MTIDRKKLIKQTEEAAARSGKFRYIPKDSTQILRILEYTDSGGSQMFAQPLVEHREEGKSGKSSGICRMEIFGEPCAFCKANEVARDSGQKTPFTSKIRYIINAVNINEDPNKVKLWIIPTTIFKILGEFLLDDEWADVLEPKKGYAFSVKREGSGLDTEYSAKPQRNAYPVGKAVVQQTIDPLTEIRDPGLESQCATIGMDINDLFDETEISELSSSGGKTPSEKKSTTQEPEPKSASGLEVGVAVTYLGEKEVCHIKSIDEKNEEVEIEDATGNTYDVDPNDLTVIEEKPEKEESVWPEIDCKVRMKIDGEYYEGEITKINKAGDKVNIIFDDGEKYSDVSVDEIEESESKPKKEKPLSGDEIPFDKDNVPKCFGDDNLRDVEDDECKGCNCFKECGDVVGAAEPEPAGKSSKKAKTVTKKAEKKSSKKNAKTNDTDSTVADILG